MSETNNLAKKLIVGKWDSARFLEGYHGSPGFQMTKIQRLLESVLFGTPESSPESTQKPLTFKSSRPKRKKNLYLHNIQEKRSDDEQEQSNDWNGFSDKKPLRELIIHHVFHLKSYSTEDIQRIEGKKVISVPRMKKLYFGFFMQQ